MVKRTLTPDFFKNKNNIWVEAMKHFKTSKSVSLNVSGGVRSGKSSAAMGLFQSSHGESAVLEKVHVLETAMCQLRELDRVLCYCSHSSKQHAKQGFMCIACGCKHFEAFQ